MPHSRFSGEEIAQRGEELYEQRFRILVETEENIGKIISITGCASFRVLEHASSEKECFSC